MTPSTPAQAWDEARAEAMQAAYDADDEPFIAEFTAAIHAIAGGGE